MTGPAEAGPVALITDRACRILIGPVIYPAALLISKRFVQKILVLGFEIVRKTQDLKTIISTDDPNLQLRAIAVPVSIPVANAIGVAFAGNARVEARVTSHPIHRSIGDRVP